MKRMRILRSVMGVLLASLGVALPRTMADRVAAQGRPADITTTTPPIYWGALVDGAPGSLSAYTTFETLAQKNVSILHTTGPASWFTPFPASYLDSVRDRGAIPMFTWMSQNVRKSSDIYTGAYDSYIRSFANAALRWGHPFD